MGESRPKNSKNQLLTGSLARYGKNRCVPQVRRGSGLLGSASGGGYSAHAAHAWGLDADQVSQLGRFRTRSLYHRGSDPIAAQSAARRPRSGFLLRVHGRRPLSRQCVPQGNRHWCGISIDPHDHAQHGPARLAADREKAVRLPPGHDSGDRLHGYGKGPPHWPR